MVDSHSAHPAITAHTAKHQDRADPVANTATFPRIRRRGQHQGQTSADTMVVNSFGQVGNGNRR